MTQPVPTRPAIRFQPREQRAMLIVGDLIVSFIALAFALYFWGRGDEWLRFSLDFLEERVPLWFYLLPFFWIVMMVELYDLHRASNWAMTLRGVAIASITGSIIYTLIYFSYDPGSLPRRGIAGFVIATSLLTLAWRMVYIRVYTTPAFMRRVLILGAGESGKTIVKIYKQLLPPPFSCIGYVDDDPEKIGTEVEGFPVLSSSEELLELINERSVTDLVVAISGELKGSTFQALLDTQVQGINITRMPRMYEELLGRVPIHYLDSDWVIRAFVDEVPVSGFYEITKRLIDIAGGIIGLIGFALLFPIIAVATIVDSGRPIFYSQTRSGKGAHPYRMLKIRTMRQDAEKDGVVRLAERRDPRITRVGHVLRRARIDELPQFLNVLRGEMSLVGPRAERPELVAEFQQQIPFYRSRLLVKPGITGWAQVNFDYASTVEDMAVKLEYDLYYIKHRSLIMDIVIMLRTIGTVFGFKGR